MVSTTEVLLVAHTRTKKFAATVTVAAVVVLIDLLRTPSADLETGDALIKRKEVTKAVAQISQIADMSHSAKGSVRVINQLLG